MWEGGKFDFWRRRRIRFLAPCGILPSNFPPLPRLFSWIWRPVLSLLDLYLLFPPKHSRYADYSWTRSTWRQKSTPPEIDFSAFSQVRQLRTLQKRMFLDCRILYPLLDRKSNFCTAYSKSIIICFTSCCEWIKHLWEAKFLRVTSLWYNSNCSLFLLLLQLELAFQLPIFACLVVLNIKYLVLIVQIAIRKSQVAVENYVSMQIA